MLASAAVALGAVSVYLTVRASPVPVSPPTPQGADASRCARLVAGLPASLDGRATRPVTPPSPLTAAWGRPAITLRCGLPQVADPVSDGEFCFDGVGDTCAGAVGWFRDPFDATLWQTRVTPVLAVHIPAGDGVADVLQPLSGAVSRVR